MLMVSKDLSVNKKLHQNKIESHHPRTGFTETLFGSCDLDLDPMTFTYEADLKMLKTNVSSRNELFGSKLSIAQAEVCVPRVLFYCVWFTEQMERLAD